MKYILLLIIKLYWILIPQSKRKKCIFRKSCSKYVYDITIKEGSIKGFKALKFRIKNCKPGFIIFKNPISEKTQMLLPNHQVIEENNIAKRLL